MAHGIVPIQMGHLYRLELLPGRFKLVSFEILPVCPVIYKKKRLLNFTSITSFDILMELIC
jgi:hypothetical protein